MKYIFINDIEKKSKFLEMAVFNVSMWWVTKNIRIDLYSLIKVFGDITCNFLMVYTKSHLMN